MPGPIDPLIPDDAARNRAYWDGYAATYQAEHGQQLENELTWGTYSIPEKRVKALGSTTGKDVLELGCGGGQWSIFLAVRGARVVGLDNSAAQLEFAEALAKDRGVDVRFVHAAAENIPLADDSFDLVFCDHGAMSYADPRSTLPEVGRLLRPGGRLVFNQITPFAACAWNDESGSADETLRYDYFDRERWDDVSGFVGYELGYGAWIRLFREHGFSIDDLIELRPPKNAKSTYRSRAETEWARRWPAEHLWCVTKT